MTTHLSKTRSYWCWVSDGLKVATWVGTFVSFGLAFFILPTYWLPAAIPTAYMFALLLVLAVVPTRVMVGSDGIQWKHLIPCASVRFASYANIDEVENTPKGLVLVLRSGQRVPFYTSGMEPEKVRTMRNVVREELFAWRSWTPSVAMLPSVDAGAYRAMETKAALLNVASTYHAPAEMRVEAANRLVPVADDGVLAKMVELLSATAEPTAREAFIKLVGESPASPRDRDR